MKNLIILLVFLVPCLYFIPGTLQEKYLWFLFILQSVALVACLILITRDDYPRTKTITIVDEVWSFVSILILNLIIAYILFLQPQ